MLLHRAIVRPEKASKMLKVLIDLGFPGITKMPVFGRGKLRGLTVRNIVYHELSFTAVYHEGVRGPAKKNCLKMPQPLYSR